MKRAQKQLSTLVSALGPNFSEVPARRVFLALGFEVEAGTAGSGKANKVLAAHRAYGLLKVTRSVDAESGAKRRLVSLTGRGRKLAQAESLDAPALLRPLRRAALEPMVFRRVWHKRRPEITEPELAEALTTQGRFTEPGAKRAARVYFANRSLARLDDPAFRSSGDAPALEAKTAPKPTDAQLRPTPAPAVAAKGPQRLHIPLGEAGIAVIPAGLDEADFKRLMQTLRLWKSALVK